MNYLIAGAAVGLLLASVWITWFCLSFFMLYKSGSLFVTNLLNNQAPSKIIFPFIILINPTAVGLGVMFSYIFAIFEKAYPESGLLSPNLFYSVMILLLSVVLFTPLLYLARGIRSLILGAMLSFVLSFGWLIPYLAI